MFEPAHYFSLLRMDSGLLAQCFLYISLATSSAGHSRMFMSRCTFLASPQHVQVLSFPLRSRYGQGTLLVRQGSLFISHVCPYELFRLPRVDGVTITAQSSHSDGSPISQRESAGFNWPPLVIPAEEPVSRFPEAVSLAGSTSVESCTRLLPVMCSVMVPPRSASVAEGVVQSAVFTW